MTPQTVQITTRLLILVIYLAGVAFLFAATKGLGGGAQFVLIIAAAAFGWFYLQKIFEKQLDAPRLAGRQAIIDAAAAEKEEYERRHRISIMRRIQELSDDECIEQIKEYGPTTVTYPVLQHEPFADFAAGTPQAVLAYLMASDERYDL